MGNSDVEKNVQKLGVGQAIVANFEIMEYVGVVYRSQGNMASRFAMVNPDALERVSALCISKR